MLTINKVLIYIYSQDAYNLTGTISGVINFAHYIRII